MLRSMTGFGAGEVDNEEYRYTVEIKSVNQRYMDVEIHMPRILNIFDERIRKVVKDYVSRGKLVINIGFTDKKPKAHEIKVDKNLALAYGNALKEINALLGMPQEDYTLAVARMPDVLIVEDQASELEGSYQYLESALKTALEHLVSMRKREGQIIQEDFLKRINILETYVDEVSELAADIVQNFRERLQATLDEVLSQSQVDETRLVQETAIFADRANFTEEIVRLRSHFRQFLDMVTKADEPVGRKLDFLIQEMNREINTTASKANNVKAAQIAVEVKGEIEKLREQVQNIE